MSGFRTKKHFFKTTLAQQDWQEKLCAVLTTEEAVSTANALLSMLPRHELRWRAASCIGEVVATLAEKDLEKARIFMRRLMWSMNEESGNIGWGIPETMGCCAAASPILAKEYERVITSYIIDTGKSSNYIDHAPLRLSSYWAVGHMVAKRKEFFSQTLPWLVLGLADSDAQCRGMATWALCQLAERQLQRNQAPTPEKMLLWQQGESKMNSLITETVEIEIFEKLEVLHLSTQKLAQRALASITLFCAV